jgi:transposase
MRLSISMLPEDVLSSVTVTMNLVCVRLSGRVSGLIRDREFDLEQEQRTGAGRSKAAATGKGNPWLGGTLGEAAAGAARTSTFLAARYKRVLKRRGKKRALVAVGNSILTICWHLLSDPDARFTDLGPDWHDRLAPQRRKRQLIAELERLSGKKVLLQEAAA